MIDEELATRVTAVALALAAPATAGAAAELPGARGSRQGPGQARGKGGTLTVCKRRAATTGRSGAVNAATGRDTIRVRRGTYREGVQIAAAATTA